MIMHELTGSSGVSRTFYYFLQIADSYVARLGIQVSLHIGR